MPVGDLSETQHIMEGSFLVVQILGYFCVCFLFSLEFISFVGKLSIFFFNSIGIHLLSETKAVYFRQCCL